MNTVYIETTPPKEGKRTNEFQFFEYILNTIGIEVKIIGIGGKKKLKFFENELKDTTRRGFKNLVVLDADGSENVSDWTFESEKAKIESLKSELNVEFDLFFLPNNQDEGDFEVLLESLINPNHTRILDCHKDFETCIEKYKTYNSPNQKARIYSYITSFKMTNSQTEKFKKGDWFFENTDFWDINLAKPALQPLISFLKL
jgi:hypothetical protein